MSSESLTTGLHPSEIPHRRFNPLTNTHVLVSPHRTKRPWKGQIDPPNLQVLPRHTEDCYLCPGNERMNGVKNPRFEDTLVFENDFPALLGADVGRDQHQEGEDHHHDHDQHGTTTTTTTTSPSPSSELFQTSPTFGSCKVLTYSPRHDLTLALMSIPEIQAVIECWTGVYKSEGEVIRAGHRERGGVEGAGEGDEGCVNIFENRGSMMGASAPHPHGQVWSTSFVPAEPATELASLRTYTQTHPSHCLLCDYAQQEVTQKRGERVVVLDEESGWVGLVPFWATWPFEIMVLPYKRHISNLTELTESDSIGLAKVLNKILIKYDNLFTTPFPYSMGIHQAPLPPKTGTSTSATATTADATTAADPAHFHIHFYPPLLRSSSVRKFLVGFELFAEAQRDLTPEQAAQRLRDQDDVHYTKVASGEGEGEGSG